MLLLFDKKCYGSLHVQLPAEGSSICYLYGSGVRWLLPHLYRGKVCTIELQTSPLEWVKLTVRFVPVNYEHLVFYVESSERAEPLLKFFQEAKPGSPPVWKPF